MSSAVCLPCWQGHVLILAAIVVPALLSIDANLNIVFTASIVVFTGCWRSVKETAPTESMTKKEAIRFPIVGSAVLLSLFLAFKFLPKNLLNLTLAFYFGALGTVALTAAVSPFLAPLFPKSLRERELKARIPTIPPATKEPIDVEATVPEVVTGVFAAGFCIWYLVKKHWLANNILGVAFSLEGIEHLNLGSVQVGGILLVGLFFYDIFWVFFTPVMVNVAKSLDAPIKLLFPRGIQSDGKALPFSMLGLGDIVIPGMFVALMLRYDVANKHKTTYFYSAFGGYTIGIVSTLIVMNWFQAAQPALLYIVPAVLGCVSIHALTRKELSEVFHYEEVSAESATPSTNDKRD